MTKRAWLFILITLLGLAFNVTLVSAQAPDAAPPEPASEPAVGEATEIIFPWAFKAGGFDENWPEGVAHVLLGIAGALVTVYLFLGDFLPSMGGKAEYESLKLELEDFKSRRNKVLAIREQYVNNPLDPLVASRLDAYDKLSDDYDRIIDRLEKQMSQERWRLLLMGFPMYVLLGGFFATAFATNLLQAILIGFGWTAVADRIGLEREQTVKGELRDESVTVLEQEAASQAKRAQEALQEVQKQQAIIENQKRLIDELSNAPESS